LPAKRTGHHGQPNEVTDVTNPRLGRWLAWGRQDRYLGYSRIQSTVVGPSFHCCIFLLLFATLWWIKLCTLMRRTQYDRLSQQQFGCWLLLLFYVDGSKCYSQATLNSKAVKVLINFITSEQERVSYLGHVIFIAATHFSYLLTDSTKKKKKTMTIRTRKAAKHVGHVTWNWPNFLVSIYV